MVLIFGDIKLYEFLCLLLNFVSFMSCIFGFMWYDKSALRENISEAQIFHPETVWRSIVVFGFNVYLFP